jgi:anti-anti-sigma factor
MQTVAPGCELDVERGPDWLLVRVRNFGSMGSGSPALAEHLWHLLEQHFTYRLVLELDGVEELDSGFIEQLIQLHQWIREHDGVMRLCGLSAQNCRVLHACRLDERLLPYEDREEAVMGCHHPGRPR